LGRKALDMVTASLERITYRVNILKLSCQLLKYGACSRWTIEESEKHSEHPFTIKNGYLPDISLCKCTHLSAGTASHKWNHTVLKHAFFQSSTCPRHVISLSRLLLNFHQWFSKAQDCYGSSVLAYSVLGLELRPLCLPTWAMPPGLSYSLTSFGLIPLWGLVLGLCLFCIFVVVFVIWFLFCF
jgi:hypothetical protein